MASIEAARDHLNRWAEWWLRGKQIQSRIGYPSQTVERRAVMGGGGAEPACIVPTWFRGVEESKTERFIMQMPEPTFLAIALHYLWTTRIENGEQRRVTRVMRSNYWSQETNMDPRSYTNHVLKGERALAGTILGD